MPLYFDSNTITAKPQNASGTGFNEWGQIKYNPDAYGLNLLDSIGITSLTSWTYANLTTQLGIITEMTADLDGDGVYTNVLYSFENAGQLSEYIRVNLNRICDKDLSNGLYLSWINSNGGIEYEFFKDKIEQDINSENTVIAENYISDLRTANKKQYTFAGQSVKSYKVIKTGLQRHVYINNEQISNIERYNDLKANSLTNDVFVYTRRFFGRIDITDYDSTKSGTCKCSCENHGQNTGDEIVILSNTYSGTYKVFKIDNNSFYILAVYSSDESTVFNRIVKSQDWQRCLVSNFNVIESGVNNNFAVSFDIKTPSFGVK